MEQSSKDRHQGGKGEFSHILPSLEVWAQSGFIVNQIILAPKPTSEHFKHFCSNSMKSRCKCSSPWHFYKTVKNRTVFLMLELKQQQEEGSNILFRRIQQLQVSVRSGRWAYGEQDENAGSLQLFLRAGWLSVFDCEQQFRFFPVVGI